MRILTALALALGLATATLALEPARFTLRLDKAGADGATVTLQAIHDGTAFTGAAAGLALDGQRLRGELKAADATYALDATITDYTLAGTYTGTRGSAKLAGALAGAWTVRWTGYRGVEGTGIADGPAPPVACDDRTGQNILWKVPVANWGHAQPVVIGDRVFVVSEGGWPADQDVPLLQCFDIATGKEVWRKTLDHLAATGLSEAEQQAARDAWRAIHARMRTAFGIFNEYIYAADQAGKDAAVARFKAHGMTFSGWSGGGYGQLRKLGNKWNGIDMRAAAKAGLYPETWQYECGMGQSCIGQVYATPVTDGADLYIATSFGAFYRIDRDGHVKWLRFDLGKPGEFCRNGRSPLLYRDLFISDIQGKLRAIDRETGALKWSGPVDDGAILTPIVITCGDTDILLCSNRRAFCLPDGKPLTLEGGTDFGTTALVNTDERDVAIFTGGGEHGGWGRTGVQPCAAVRFRLEEDKLIGTVLWSGIGGGYTDILYADGKLYHGGTGSVFDAITGKVVAGSGTRDRNAARVVPPTGHMFVLAGGRMYGLRASGGGEGSPGQSGLLACWTPGGGRLGEGTLLNAPVEGEKQRQVIEQNGWNTWMFSYACPFTVHQGRIYVRSYDYLWCIGSTAAGSLQDDPAALKAIAVATDGAALLPFLTHAGAGVRCAAVKRAIDLPSPALKDALFERLKADPQPEVRAAAMRALDAIDPAAAPGTAELRALVLKSAVDSREWWKPEKVAPWEFQKQVLAELSAHAEPIVLALLADKEPMARWAGLAVLDAAAPPPGDALRDALIRVSAQPGEARVGAVVRLAAYRDAAPAQAAFAAVIADAGARDEARIAMETLVATKTGDARAAFLREQIGACANVPAFRAVAAVALAETPQPDWLLDALVARAKEKNATWAVPAAATALLAQAEPTEKAVEALTALATGGDFWTARPAIEALLALQAGGEAEALAALGQRIGGPKDGNSMAVADVLAARAPGLKDPARRAEAVALLQRLLALDNPDLQRKACTTLGAMADDAKPALPAIKALTTHANAQLKQAATDAVAKIGE